MIGARPTLPYCAEQVRQGDPDRFLTALFAPAAKRDHLLALFAFNLELARVVESVREPTLGVIRLQWWREALAEAFAGTPRRHPVVEALAAAAPAGLPHAPLERCIDGREFDLADAPPASFNALVEYAAETSGALMEAAARLLSGGGELAAPLRLACQEAGIAWALVGVVRAVPFHAGQGRVLLPADLMARHGLAPRELLERRAGPALAAVAGAVLDEAARRLAAARACRDPAIRAALPALLPASLADLYIRTLRRAGGDPFGVPPRLPAYRLQLRLLRQAMTGRF